MLEYILLYYIILLHFRIFYRLGILRVTSYLMPSWDTGKISKYNKILIEHFELLRKYRRNFMLNSGIGVYLNVFQIIVVILKAGYFTYYSRR